jgi:endonuclease/exonuclease/phosphatase family metal-dependent hydrolase
MKLISLNVEGSKHWNLVDPFLAGEKPDVICLQEVFEDYAKQFAETHGMYLAFASMSLRPNGEPPMDQKKGIAMLSRIAMDNITIEDYHQPSGGIQPIGETHDHALERTVRRSLLRAKINCDGKTFTVATTHFTWTPDGFPRDYQYAAAEKLLALLEKIPEVVLCGDFNMPRGVNDIYERFAKKYHDAIPATYVSSLDLNLHRIGKDSFEAQKLAGYMVDYLFLSNDYRAENVRLESGVSDHCAIVATVDIAS